jgi:hypothetical protein
MEPLDDRIKQKLLRERPQASPEDIAEYERLLSLRFSLDPSTPKSPDSHLAAQDREQRLRQLYAKLFLD